MRRGTAKDAFLGQKEEGRLDMERTILDIATIHRCKSTTTPASGPHTPCRHLNPERAMSICIVSRKEISLQQLVHPRIGYRITTSCNSCSDHCKHSAFEVEVWSLQSKCEVAQTDVTIFTISGVDCPEHLSFLCTILRTRQSCKSTPSSLLYTPPIGFVSYTSQDHIASPLCSPRLG